MPSLQKPTRGKTGQSAIQMPVTTRAQERARTQHCRAGGCGRCHAKEDKEEVCCICSEPIDEDRALSCPRGHDFDFECIKKMIETRIRRSTRCTGLIWKCPLCRAKCRLGFLHVLMLLKDSSSKMQEEFHCFRCAMAWQHGEVGVAEDDGEARCESRRAQ